MTGVIRKKSLVICVGAMLLLALTTVSVVRLDDRQEGQVVVSAFIIYNGASLREIHEHQRLSKSLADMGSNASEPKRWEGFHVSGHRISGGEDTIISFRKFLPLDGPSTDQNYFEKITIMLPKGTFSRVSPGKIEVGRKSDILAFWSEGNSSLPFVQGCYGYADSGQIDYEWGAPTAVLITLNLEIGRMDAGASLAGCKPFTYSEQWMFRVTNASDLTPWDGGYTGTDISQESLPD